MRDVSGSITRDTDCWVNPCGCDKNKPGQKLIKETIEQVDKEKPLDPAMEPQTPTKKYHKLFTRNKTNEKGEGCKVNSLMNSPDDRVQLMAQIQSTPISISNSEYKMKEINPQLINLIKTQVGGVQDEQNLEYQVYQCSGCGALIFRDRKTVITTLREQEDQLSIEVSPLTALLNLLKLTNQEKPLKEKFFLLNQRKTILDLIIQLCETLEQRQKTMHFAITYLDIVLDNQNLFTQDYSDKVSFPKAKWKLQINEHLLAAACVLLASKFYEIDDNLVMINDLQKELKNSSKLVYEEVQRTEVLILDQLGWNLYRSTPLDYVQTLIQIGVIQSNDTISGCLIKDLPKPEQIKIVAKAEKLCCQLCDKVMEASMTRIYKPWELALAIVKCVRVILKIDANSLVLLFLLDSNEIQINQVSLKLCQFLKEQKAKVIDALGIPIQDLLAALKRLDPQYQSKGRSSRISRRDKKLSKVISVSSIMNLAQVSESNASPRQSKSGSQAVSAFKVSGLGSPTIKIQKCGERNLISGITNQFQSKSPERTEIQKKSMLQTKYLNQKSDSKEPKVDSEEEEVTITLEPPATVTFDMDKEISPKTQNQSRLRVDAKGSQKSNSTTRVNDALTQRLDAIKYKNIFAKWRRDDPKPKKKEAPAIAKAPQAEKEETQEEKPKVSLPEVVVKETAKKEISVSQKASPKDTADTSTGNKTANNGQQKQSPPYIGQYGNKDRGATIENRPSANMQPPSSSRLGVLTSKAGSGDWQNDMRSKKYTRHAIKSKILGNPVQKPQPKEPKSEREMDNNKLQISKSMQVLHKKDAKSPNTYKEIQKGLAPSNTKAQLNNLNEEFTKYTHGMEIKEQIQKSGEKEKKSSSALPAVAGITSSSPAKESRTVDCSIQKPRNTQQSRATALGIPKGKDNNAIRKLSIRIDTLACKIGGADSALQEKVEAFRKDSETISIVQRDSKDVNTPPASKMRSINLSQVTQRNYHPREGLARHKKPILVETRQVNMSRQQSMARSNSKSNKNLSNWSTRPTSGSTNTKKITANLGFMNTLNSDRSHMKQRHASTSAFSSRKNSWQTKQQSDTKPNKKIQNTKALLLKTTTDITFDRLDSENSIILEANVEDELPKVEEVIEKVQRVPVTARITSAPSSVNQTQERKRRRTAMERKNRARVNK